MFKDYDVFIYYGVGHATLINRLLAQGIYVKRAISDEKQLTIYTNYKDRQKIIALFDELCYNYKISKSVGFMRTLKNILLRKGLAVSILFAIIFFSLMPYFVLDIRIKSETISKSEIERTLKENGIYRGKFVSRMDTKALERAVQKIDGVAFATVERVGNAVLVTVHEELPKIQIFDVTGGKPVIAVSDAVVSRQVIYSGTANFKKGNIVRAGETLISPYVLVGDNQVEVSARGEIYGYVSYTANIMYRENRIEKQRSGNSVTYSRIKFIGLEAKETLPPYTMYESVTTYYKGGYMVPIEKISTTYYEIVDVNVFEPISEAETRLINKLNETVLEKIPPASRIIQKNARVVPMGDYYMVEVAVQVEQRIDRISDK